MQTALRKMGNSTGMILPRAILGEIGVTTGAAMDLRVEDGRLIVTPVHKVRDGWAEAAAQIAAAEEDPDEDAWSAFGSDGDDALKW